MDHVVIRYLIDKKDSKTRLIRSVFLFQELNFKVKYRKRCDNQVADHLSQPETNIFCLDERDIVS